MNSPLNSLKNIHDFRRDQLAELFKTWSFSQHHAKTIFQNLYKKIALNPWTEEATFSKRFQNQLSEYFFVTPLKISSQQVSRYDNSIKFLFQLSDGQVIETVLMPEKSRLTLCLSSQVGCAQGCVFCHTGRMGLKRNLSTSEIVGQVWTVQKWLEINPLWPTPNRVKQHDTISNIVFMGMGEPLDNVDAVSTSLAILTDPLGFGLGKKKISISTAGHLDGLKELLGRHPDATLALSLHSPFDHERSKILPINRRYPLIDVLDYLRTFPKKTILIQYTLIENVNDSVIHARELVTIIKDLKVKVNLIPLNPIAPSRLTASADFQIQLFKQVLFESGVRTMVRYSKGQDINGACGQLAAIKNQ